MSLATACYRPPQTANSTAGKPLSGDHLLGLILAASPDLIYLYDRLEERYLFVSERSTSMLGYAPQHIMQLKSADIHDLIHPEDLAHAKAHYANQEQLADTEISMTIYRVRHAQGDYRLLRCRQKVFSRDHAGRAKCILGVASDITDEARRQVEVDALRAQILRIRDEERRRLALRLHDTDQPLTPRERSVAQLVAEGHSNKQIANVLGVGLKTVETHRAAVMRKLDLASTAALVRYAVRNKMIEPLSVSAETTRVRLGPESTDLDRRPAICWSSCMQSITKRRPRELGSPIRPRGLT